MRTEAKNLFGARLIAINALYEDDQMAAADKAFSPFCSICAGLLPGRSFRLCKCKECPVCHGMGEEMVETASVKCAKCDGSGRMAVAG